jgi:hypothetical protein
MLSLQVFDNTTINFLESNRIFLTELAPVKKFDAWQNVTINALIKCVDPATSM